MEDVQKYHEYLLRQRTLIRNCRRTLQSMRRCWKLVPRADPSSLSLEEYEGMYSTLLYEMTICWEEEINDAVLAKMWRRDACSYRHLDFDRFCCSVFYYVEMWVQDITQDAYDHIFAIVHTILAGHEFTQLLPADSTGPTFKPTLESFDNALDHEKAMEELNMNIGKSIFFDAARYFQHFGAPTAAIQATPVNIFHLHSNRATERTALGRTPCGDLDGPPDPRYCHYEISLPRPNSSGCSNPKLLRPSSSRHNRRQSASAQLLDQAFPGLAITSDADDWLLAGTAALKPPTLQSPGK